MKFESISPIGIEPLTAHVGARVTGYDPRTAADAATVAALCDALRKHHLLLIRQEGVSDEDQIRFGNLFGEVKVRRPRQNESADNPTQYVSNRRAEGILGEGEIVFHQDHMFFEHPVKAIVLYGIAIPSTGSATKFRNAHTVFANLAPELQQRARGVRCDHLFDYTADYNAWMDPAKAPPDSPRAWQPLVWTGEDGCEYLWLSPLSAVGFTGTPDGPALIEDLRIACETIENQHTYVHQWSVGDMVIWNNRTLHHARLPFDSSEDRTLRRSSIV